MMVQAPLRIKRTYVQHISAPPEKVFPLLCPVRELDWVEGWNPRAVYTYSGIAEQDCVFIIPDSDREAIWMITRYNPENFQLEFIKITPGFTAGKIEIRLAEDAAGNTEAEVSYGYTALSESGAEFVKNFSEAVYGKFMKKWEDALNDYLAKNP
jgi:hypothetical protein